MHVLSLSRPEILVVAEDVQEGKPDPACTLGHERLRLKDSSSIVVLEDAPSGIIADKLANFKVTAFATTHSVNQQVQTGLLKI